jgi:virulence-associated protein VapD
MFMNDFKGDDPFTQVEVEVDEQFSTVTHKIVHTRAQLNLLAQYKFKETKLSESRIEPYVLAGPTIGYLLSSSFDGLLQVENNYENAGNLDNTNSYDPIAFSLMAGAGFKYKMGSIYITADVRYQYGLFNIVNEKNRYTTPENNTLRNVYLYEDNDFSLQQGMFHVGIVYPYFKPKKLKK